MSNYFRRFSLDTPKAFASLLGLMIAAALCLLLYWFLIRPTAPKDPSLSSIDRSFKESQMPNPVDTSSQTAVYHSVVGQIKSIEAQNIKRGDELMKEIEDLNQGAYSGFDSQ